MTVSDDRLGREFLGVGWAFPPRIDSATGLPARVSYEEDIRQSILIILTTAKGERVMRPGDVVCFPSGEAGAHEVRGPGRFLLVSAAQPTSVCVYPDSGKVGTRPATGDDRLDFRRADAVGYWDGER